MDFGGLIGEILGSPLLRKVPSSTLVSSVVATAIHGALAASGFSLPGAGAVLGQIGFKIGEAFLPSVVSAAKEGVDHLGDWLEEKMQAEPGVNEAASSVLAKQVRPVAEIVQRMSSPDAGTVAKKMGEGMAASGGAVALIASDYAAALTPGGNADEMQKKMLARIASWADQSIEARRGSLIENARQKIGKGSSGTQKILADEQSTIRGATQEIE